MSIAEGSVNQDHHHYPHKHDQEGAYVVLLALGIVFGDIGTSPLYALKECFNGPHGIPLVPENIHGVLSLVFWALMTVVSFKYLEFVTKADNKGEGGVLALTTLIANPDQFTKSRPYQKLILGMGLFGSALLVGDGMLTPAISVLSAIEGLNVATSFFQPVILPITILIITGLFAIQKHGTATIGNFFGPIMLLWFAVLAGMGAHSIWLTPAILYSLNPYEGIHFLTSQPHIGMIVLGSIFLVATGGEALYADMGHFGRVSIKRGWYLIVLPALIMNYFGQGALLLRDPSAIANPFYYLAPQWGLYPLVLLSTMATIIASQAIISGLFSLAKQCAQLGYSPRLTIVHTSHDKIGQIYVPAMNWITYAGTIWLVMEFRTSTSLAGAYGIAVSLTMVITSILALMVADLKWGWSHKKVACVGLFLLSIDIGFLIPNTLKIPDGGWVTIAIASFMYMLMLTWQAGRTVLVQRLRKSTISFDRLLARLKEDPPLIIKGTGVYMLGDPTTVPYAFTQNLRHFKVVHETVVFLTLITKEVPKVRHSERLHIEELAPGFYRVIASYGFKDSPNTMTLLESIHRHIRSIDPQETTFFLGRESLIIALGTELSLWRKRVFVFLAKNAVSATSYYRIPQNKVIEVGIQIDL